MIRDIYHIKVKIERAGTILEDMLEKGEIEIIEEDDTPEWQKQEVRRRIQAVKENPSLLISEEDFFKALESEDEEV